MVPKQGKGISNIVDHRCSKFWDLTDKDANSYTPSYHGIRKWHPTFLEPAGLGNMTNNGDNANRYAQIGTLLCTIFLKLTSRTCGSGT